MVKHTLNQKIYTLWQSFDEAVRGSRAPLFYHDFQVNSLLFVGMNPSFSEKGFKSFLKGTSFENVDPEQFLAWNRIKDDESLVSEILDLEFCARKNYDGYFKKLRDIAAEQNVSFEHIDMFLGRETSQKEFLKTLYERGKKFNAFGLGQLEIFFEALNLAQPKCIVIANAKASEIFKSLEADKISWDEAAGHHWYTTEDRSVPIFFTSMLTGQRALDTGSLQRLRWHINKAMQ